jgi:acyl-CoA reductase-like NAD-dependent aldehyde dehydrogenase
MLQRSGECLMTYQETGMTEFPTFPSFVGGAVCEVSEAIIESAVARATRSASLVRALSSHDRALILDRVALTLEAEIDALSAEIAAESGSLTARDMLLEVRRAAEVFTLCAAQVRIGLSEMLAVDSVERGRGVLGYVTRVPIGPILGITAYNGPLLIAAHKIAPAVGAGAPIVIKPSPRVPRAAIRLAQMVVAAGWPADALSVVTADNAATLALVRDPRLPVISFTGGDFGWTIREMAPRKKVHLELGGVGAVYVAADANLDIAARECAEAAFVRSGQSCIAVQRIYVEGSVYTDFAQRFVTEVAAMQPGRDRAIGPMVDADAAVRVEGFIDDARTGGATVLCGGRRDGAALAPTVLANVAPDMQIMRLEAFGPVVALCAVDGLDDAIDQINAVSGAIHHGLYTADIDTALAAVERIRAGGVVINGPGTWRVDHAPYGGTGTSGTGREGCRYAIEEFTEPRVVIIRPSTPRR